MEQEILRLKAKAKNLRDFDMYEDAINCIKKAIVILESVERGKETDEDISEMADCYGIMGGLYRRWGLNEISNPSIKNQRLSESSKAYAKGSEYEKKTKFPSSYNSLNSQIALIFEQADIINENSFKNNLQKIKENIEKQINTYRKKDIWALADLFLIKLLLNIDAQQSFKEFNAGSPPQFIFTSLLSTLEPLAKLNTLIKPRLNEAVDILKRLT